MNASQKLRAIVEVSHITQNQLASRLSVSFPTLNSWMNNRSQPRPNAMAKIDLLYAEVTGSTWLGGEELQTLIEEAESQCIKRKSFVDDRDLLDRLTLALTYHTDAIEGSTMTIADTRVVLFEGKSISNRTFVEQLEAKNHQAALWWLMDELQKENFELTEDLILQLHTRLMNGILSDAGFYRRHPVRIAGTRVPVANYLRVSDLITQLLTVDIADKSVVRLMAEHHARFEKIHPFSDGNGRIGRLLLVALALMNNVVPPIILRERRGFYYKALELAQVDENYAPLEQLIAESILSAQRELWN